MPPIATTIPKSGTYSKSCNKTGPSAILDEFILFCKPSEVMSYLYNLYGGPLYLSKI